VVTERAEMISGELGGTCEDNAHLELVLLSFEQFLSDHLSLGGREIIDKKFTVKMINFMLYTNRQ
jgi:hypothetical protein